MQAAIGDPRRKTHVLHDVDLAACRPVHRGDVIAEHPEGRPHALAERDFDARLDAAVLDSPEALGLDARGSIDTRGRILDVDVEVAEAIHVGVFGGVGIGFELLVIMYDVGSPLRDHFCGVC